mgnify:CR=1 FL=1
MRSKYTEFGHRAPIKTIQQILREIQPDEVYRPVEIVKNGWIKDTRGNPNYFYLLDRIKNKEIPAKNIGNKTSEKARYIIKGQDLIDFLNKKFLQ